MRSSLLSEIRTIENFTKKRVSDGPFVDPAQTTSCTGPQVRFTMNENKIHMSEQEKSRSDSFQCVLGLSGGCLHENTKSLLGALADACSMPRKRIYAEFQLLLQELNGAVI